MPVLNEEGYLADAVAAVLSQSYPAEAELVIALGASTDRTTEIAHELAAADDRVRLVDNPANDIPVGLNLAIAASRHPIVVRVDAHAELPENYTLTMVGLLNQTGAVNVGGVVKVGTPKTHELRSVALPRFLVELLAEACRGKDHADILFPATAGGYAKSPGANTWFSGAVDRCVAASAEARAKERKRRPKAEPTTPVFPRITPHGLRHTAASLAVQSGANVKAVQRMLGHASATMTLDTYADLFDTDLEDVADAIVYCASAPEHVNVNRLELMSVMQSFAGFSVKRS